MDSYSLSDPQVSYKGLMLADRWSDEGATVCDWTFELQTLKVRFTQPQLKAVAMIGHSFWLATPRPSRLVNHF